MPADILTSPRCRPEQLGLPIPDDAHAVSVCLPTWANIVGYEEKDDRVISKLQAAYPRFGLHLLVKKVCTQLIDADGQLGLPFASAEVADRAVRFCKERDNVVATSFLAMESPSKIYAVRVPEQHFATLKEYWQHAGENLSSRAIEALFHGRQVAFSQTESRKNVRQRVSEIQSTEPCNVFLYPSGMAAIASAFRLTQTLKPGPTCQFGFPYVDTLKIQRKFAPAECLFLPRGNEADLEKLDSACQTSRISAVFCEVPTNPLLVTPDIKRLRQLADKHDFLLVIDDTLTACGNINVLPYSDITVTSLTKYFSGEGNVLAGSLTVNPNGQYAQKIQQNLAAAFEETLCDDDVAVLDKNSSSLTERMKKTNENALRLADFLTQQDAVEQVFYPNAQDKIYTGLQNSGGRRDGLQNASKGYGGLMSIVLRNPEQTTSQFYDYLNINKGPNLGTRFTLCCPFTMLAHYNELDFAESCGVSRWLLRISVGVEDCDDLIQRFSDALNQLNTTG